MWLTQWLWFGVQLQAHSWVTWAWLWHYNYGTCILYEKALFTNKIVLHFIRDITGSELNPDYLDPSSQITNQYRLLDSLVVECLLRVRKVPGSIHSQGPRHTKDVIKMVPVVHLFKHWTLKREILALSQELR